MLFLFIIYLLWSLSVPQTQPVTLTLTLLTSACPVNQPFPPDQANSTHLVSKLLLIINQPSISLSSTLLWTDFLVLTLQASDLPVPSDFWETLAVPNFEIFLCILDSCLPVAAWHVHSMTVQSECICLLTYFEDLLYDPLPSWLCCLPATTWFQCLIIELNCVCVWTNSTTQSPVSWPNVACCISWAARKLCFITWLPCVLITCLG